MKKKSPKENQIVDLIKEGLNMEELMETDHRGYVGYRIGATRELMATLLQIEEARKPLLYSMEDNLSEEMNDTSMELLDRLLEQTRSPSRHRQPHFYVFTETGTGKTVLLNQLSRRLRLFSMPCTHPLEGYTDGRYDMMVYEEFGPGSAKLGTMNNLTGGGTTTDGSTRYHATVKKDDIPIVIMTNHPPQDCYKNMVGSLAYDAFLTRFYFFKFTRSEPIRLFLDPEDVLDEIIHDEPLPDWISRDKPCEYLRPNQ